MTKGILCVLAALLAWSESTAQTKLLRFPDIHDDTVAFCYGGDLWRAPVGGGLAARLTAHPGVEVFPKFSPDGKWIAFTGQYDGDEQVYVIPATGGEPRQLTFYPARGPLAPRWGYDNQVYGWTLDGSAILFRSLMDANGGGVETALYTIGLNGGLPEKLPMPTSGAGDFSPDGKQIVYSPLFRDFRTWKRYEGGWAQDLWLFDIASKQTRRIAASKRTERDPMWIGDRIYFVSDRDGTLNLYAYDPAKDTVAQLTRSSVWDVRWASSDNRRRVVYELNGELHVYDTQSSDDRSIAIDVPSDGLNRRPSRYPVEKNVEDFELSPKAERAVFVARGDVFTVPIEKGPTRNVTSSSPAHDKWARWSPDGKEIAFISDRTGEDQLWIAAQDRSGQPRQVTDRFQAMLYTPEWSPDGSRLALSDKNGKLYVIVAADGKTEEIADEARGFLRDYAWSSDGKFLAFSLSNVNELSSLHIWSLADGRVRRVTGDMANAYSPVWDPEGKYLWFLSDRDYAPQISQIEWNFATNRTTGIFALVLQKDGKHPFPPESDEVKLDDAEKTEKTDKTDKKDTKGKKDTKDDTDEKKDDGDDSDEKGDDKKDKKKDEEKAKKPVRIDFDGLGDRVARAPIEAGNYDGLAVKKGHLLWISSGAPFNGRESYVKPSLRIYELEKRKETTLAEDVNAYALSRDGSKLLMRQTGAYQVLDAKPEAKDSKDKKTVSLKGLMIDRVPKDEWAEVFDEVWRRYRDFFYVKNMHGYDWKAIGDRYRALVPYVAHRSDLNYVLGEMVAELNIGHAYIQGGDFQIPDRPKVALPGARFALDEKAGRYRIARILRGDNQEEKYRAPLTEIGVDVQEGDYVLAIDGEELRPEDSPYRLLRNKTDPVTLTVNSKPKIDGSRKATYRPIDSEANLLYYEWTSGNRERVAKATDGRVGYLHIPDMGATGIAEFIKWYYPQIRKEGLVVDVRSNGGGNVSQWILERLDNKLMGTRFGNLRDTPTTYPGTVFHGHLACLINETSASDGDIFPHYFRKYGLGPLIGKRTWGGVVGVTDFGPLVDGGTLTVPFNATNSDTGDWIIEGYGVDPDIEVENDPRAVLDGGDPQLERAIAEVVKKIAAEPKKLPHRPPDPVKTR